MELFVRAALRSDDSAYATLAAETMDALGADDGDVVRIEAGDAIAAIRIRASGSATIDADDIRLPLSVRRSIGADRGESVTVTAVDDEPADSVTLSLPPNVPEADAFELVGAIDGRPVVAGQTLTLGDDRPVDGHTAASGHGVYVHVVDTEPDGVVTVREWTAVRLPDSSSDGPKSVGDTAAPGYGDIGGMESVVEQLREVVETPLSDPEAFETLDVDPPGGVLLHGPPGTGKTLLVSALAAEAELPLIRLRGVEAVSQGGGGDPFEAALSDAEARSPAILFIDDIDALSAERPGELDRRRLAQLTAMLDDRDPDSRVVVVGTTSDPERLDPSLRRSGRFDHEIPRSRPRPQRPPPDPVGSDAVRPARRDRRSRLDRRTDPRVRRRGPRSPRRRGGV